MQPTLKTRVQLELLKKLREKKNSLQKGFTLVELMIVVPIVGILSAVALPQFLQARNAAQAGANVGEALGLAKECAVLAASDVGAAPSSSTNATVSCGTSGGDVQTSWTSGVEGIRCLTSTSVVGNSKAKIDITASGGMSCTIS